MNTNTTTRRNPMTDVMPYEMLEAAYNLMERGQTVAYWEKVPVPKRPVGRVRFEVVRQVMTFAVPVVGIVGAALTHGLKGALFALPVAVAVGYALDKQLTMAINSKRRADEAVDAGRYRTVKWLSEQMGMAPEEITLDVVRKMAKDFIIVQSAVDKEVARRAAAKKEAEARAAERRRDGKSSGRFAAGGAATAAAGVVPGSSSYEEPAPYNTGMGFTPMVNPGTGLPMFPGTYVDTGGSVFGQDNGMM